jgi:acetyl esterase
MNRLRGLEDVPDQNVREILAQFDPRGNSAPIPITQKRASQLAALRRAGELAPVASVREDFAPRRGGQRIPLRVYKPDSLVANPPVVLYAHGGGFFAGSLDTHDPVCRALAHKTPAVVISVDYRLAPEHAWPAALHDCIDALRCIAQNFRASRIVLAGDSAGGNLAACAALQRSTSVPPLAGQVLIYPMLDATFSFSSYVENALVPPFTLLDCVYVWQLFLTRDADRKVPEISPALAPLERLRDVPPALIITAEYDILRDEGIEYVNRLRAAGVRADHEHYPEMTHGFLLWGATVPAAHHAFERIAKFIQSL